MLWILLLLFITMPLIELTLLLLFGSYTAWYVPLIVVIVSGVVGAVLAKRQGWQTMRRIRRELSEGQLPTDALLDAFMIFTAGVLLVTPGLITDALGMSLLIPPCRRFYKARVTQWLKKRFNIDAFTGGAPGYGKSQVIDSYVVDRDEPAQQNDESSARLPNPHETG